MKELTQGSASETAIDATLLRRLALAASPAVTPRTAWMVHEGGQRWPLVADRQFILATRDTGYRSTSAAVSELIDNALQAGATFVHVLVHEERLDKQQPRESTRRVSLAVLDNGSGMSATVLRTALQFGGSVRFNDRTGAGRSGMGLPNSSVSQSRRLELYSWLDGERPVYSYLDVREIARGSMQEVPAPTIRQLPHWVRTALDTAGQTLPSSGTLVLWPDCDRLPYRKASTLRAKLCDALGRTYRHALQGKVRLFVDGQLVQAVDPLMEWGPFREKYGTASPYGDELAYEFKVPEAPNRTSVVRVRFTVLPVRRWAHLPLEVRRELGVIGGAGVSVVRAGREVDYGWHLMGAKRRENYDDWWRCEVRFEPELDEYFGVTHSKQGIKPHPALQDVIAGDLAQIARALNGRIRREFFGLSANRASRCDTEQASPTGVFSAVKDGAIRIARERERFLPPSDDCIRRFRIVSGPLASARFFAVTLERGELVVTLNSDHPLHVVVSSADARTRDFFDRILLAAARAEVTVRSNAQSRQHDARCADNVVDALERFLDGWSDTLAAYLVRRA